jgi:glutathione-regulated potassium-efflux system protein KefB
VVIAGMGRMGQIVARILRAQKIPFIALDTSVDTIEMTRSSAGAGVLRRPAAPGDPARGQGR